MVGFSVLQLARVQNQVPLRGNAFNKNDLVKHPKWWWADFSSFVQDISIMSSIFLAMMAQCSHHLVRVCWCENMQLMEELVNTVAVLSAKPTCSTPKPYQNSCDFEWVWWKIGDSANKTPRLFDRKKQLQRKKVSVPGFLQEFWYNKNFPPAWTKPAEPEEKLRVVAYRNLVQRVLGTPQSETSKNPLRRQTKPPEKSPWKRSCSLRLLLGPNKKHGKNSEVSNHKILQFFF